MRQIDQVIEAPEDYQLSEAESTELSTLETTIERGLHVFWEVGNALFTIRDKRLYRSTHGTFDAYCRDRWQMSKTQANRLINAAGVALDLTPIGVIPSNESVARPLVSLPTEQRQSAWQKAVESAPDGKPTSADVAKAVNEIKESHSVEDSPGASPGSVIAASVESILPKLQLPTSAEWQAIQQDLKTAQAEIERITKIRNECEKQLRIACYRREDMVIVPPGIREKVLKIINDYERELSAKEKEANLSNHPQLSYLEDEVN